MKRLLAPVEHRGVDAVIIAKLGRLTRSVKDLVNRLELSEPRGVHLFSVAEFLDTGIAAGLLVMNIMASLAQWEREVIGRRTKEALGHKKTRIELVGGCPYGFRLCADGRTIEADPNEQRVRKTIPRLRE